MNIKHILLYCSISECVIMLSMTLLIPQGSQFSNFSPNSDYLWIILVILVNRKDPV